MQLLKNIEWYAQYQPYDGALQFDAEIISYKMLQERIVEVVEQLHDIPENQCVALTMNNPMSTVLYYLALIKKGCIPCVMDFRWTHEQVNKLIEKYDIAYLINNDLTVILFEQVEQNTTEIENILHIGFTSGTTGLPKAYYRNELSWLYSYEETEKLMETEIDTMIAPGPLSHSLSLFVCVFALYSGRKFIGQQQFNAQVLMDILKTDKAIKHCALFVVPTMLDTCVAWNSTMKQIRYIFTTGDKLQHSLRESVAIHFPNAILIEFFGTSEASFISYNYNNDAPSHSVGKLFPNVTINLDQIDEHGIGKLKVKSNMLFSGYIGDPLPNNSWIEIGDFASLDSEGYLYLHGRQHDRMIIGGRNVYPSEIEHFAQNFKEFNEVLVISEPHSKFGEIAVLLYTGERQVKYREFKYFLTKYLARYQMPSKLVKVSEMHYTQSGKIARKYMRSLYLKGELK
ncbi:AMP-binding protein [Staphylococcus xylosus]|uniref:AMP-binding protein n=1 Tax=Staphylococcus xylosus TaxID=1288 RepID=UPI000E681334|nr:AMP-binding protein [Staphylococcus xylosus]RIM76996.1 acyl-CoA synthetase [Staphylococcus xylosus]